MKCTAKSACYTATHSASSAAIWRRATSSARSATTSFRLTSEQPTITGAAALHGSGTSHQDRSRADLSLTTRHLFVGLLTACHKRVRLPRFLLPYVFQAY